MTVLKYFLIIDRFATLSWIVSLKHVDNDCFETLTIITLLCCLGCHCEIL